MATYEELIANPYNKTQSTISDPGTGAVAPTSPTPIVGSGSYAEDLTRSYDTKSTSLYSGAGSYSGPSIVDFLNMAGQPSDYTSRTKLASQYGITGYAGTAAQNTQLLSALKGTLTAPTAPSTGTTTPPPPTTPTTPTAPAPSPVVGTSDAEREKLRQAEIAKIKAELEPTGIAKPTTYKSLEEFNKLRTEQGVVKDEEEMAALQNESALINQELRKFTSTAGEGVPEAGRIGMVSEAERNVRFRLEDLAIRENAVVNRLNSKNAYINNALSLGFQDYQTAYTEYTNEYNKNLKAVELYNQDLDTQKKDALAAFTTISNLITEKGITQIDDNLKTQLQTSALRAGLPIEVVDLITQPGSDKIENIFSREEGIFAVMSGANGVPYVKQLSSGGGGTGNLGTSPGTDPALSGIISTILGSGSFTKQQRTDVINAINNGQDPFTVIKNQAKNIIGSQGGNELRKAEMARDALVEIGSSLQEFYNNGGDTNIIKGNFEKVSNRLGEVNDPELAAIATKVQLGIQKYRNAISGTAYSEQEGRDIASVFPGINKSETLNNAILGARNTMFDIEIDSAYSSVLGQSYFQLKDLYQTQNTNTLNTLFEQSGGSSAASTTTNTQPAPEEQKPWYQNLWSWITGIGD